MIRICIMLFDGVDDLDLVGVWVVLNKAAERLAARRSLEIVRISATGAALTTTASGMRISTEAGAEAIPDCDAIILPGGQCACTLQPTTKILQGFQAAFAQGRLFYCICSGAYLLAPAGLLAGRQVAVHATKAALLEKVGRCRATTGVIADGPIWSIGGSHASGYPKSIAMGFLVLEHFDSDSIEYVRTRLELPNRELIGAATGPQSDRRFIPSLGD